MIALARSRKKAPRLRKIDKKPVVPRKYRPRPVPAMPSAEYVELSLAATQLKTSKRVLRRAFERGEVRGKWHGKNVLLIDVVSGAARATIVEGHKRSSWETWVERVKQKWKLVTKGKADGEGEAEGEAEAAPVEEPEVPPDGV